MQTFYAIHNRYILPNRYYKIYKIDNDLYFGKMAGMFYQETIYSSSLIAMAILSILDKLLFRPRAKRKEKQLDQLIQHPTSFLEHRHNFKLSLTDDVTSVLFRHVDADATLFIKSNVRDEIEFALDGSFEVEEITKVFQPIEIKYRNYYW